MLALLAWAAVAAWLLLTARQQLDSAQDDLRRIREQADGADLLEHETRAEIDVVGARLRRATARVGSPVLAPVRFLPVVGRQLRSAEAIAGAARDAASVAGGVLRDLDAEIAAARSPDTDRVAMLRQLQAIADRAGSELRAIDLGPEDALFGTLHDARLELRRELDELLSVLDAVEVATSGLSDVVAGPGCHLLLAANNAEMRAGSGMFLQAGELCFDDGDMVLRDLTETSDLQLPATAVDIEDRDLRDRWGFLLPNAEWRNLALSPRFDANAALAADMWQAATGRAVDGVIAVDPVALSALLEATGPIEVAGDIYGAEDVVDHLLIEQYEGFMDPGYDADARKDRLGEVAEAAVAAFDSGGWDVGALVEHLPEAAAGRHVIAWARDDDAQRAWEAMGVAGTLSADSMLLSVLNRGGGRGGGKLDRYLQVAAEVQVVRRGDGATDVAVDVELANPIEPGTPTYAENPDAPDVRFGVYEGIVSLNVPGAAHRLQADGGELIARGADGPTRVIATRIEVQPSEQVTVRFHFRLPSGWSSLRIEPSARVRPTRWTLRGGESVEDVLGRTLEW